MDKIDCAALKQSEAYCVLEGISFGLSFRELYKECEDYEDEKALSKDLNRLIQAKFVIKRGNDYWHCDTKVTEAKKLNAKKTRHELEPTAENSLAQEPIINEPIEAAQEVNAQQESCHEPIITDNAAPVICKKGNLARTAGQIKVGLLFYYRRTESFTLLEIKAITNIQYVTLYAVLKRLKSAGYINTLPDGSMQWSKQYIYPFASIKPEDSAYGSLEIERRKEVQAVDMEPQVELNIESVKEEVVTAKSEDLNLLGIDAVIRRLELELAALRNVRDLYINTL